MGRLKTLAPRVAYLDARLRVMEPVEAERQRSRDRDATQHWRAWYKTAKWQRIKVRVHVRDNYICAGCPVPHVCVGKHPAPNSPVADHIKPHRGDERLFWADDNVQTVCKAYHDSEKQRLEARHRS